MKKIVALKGLDRAGAKELTKASKGLSSRWAAKRIRAEHKLQLRGAKLLPVDVRKMLSNIESSLRGPAHFTFPIGKVRVNISPFLRHIPILGGFLRAKDEGKIIGNLKSLIHRLKKDSMPYLIRAFMVSSNSPRIREKIKDLIFNSDLGRTTFAQPEGTHIRAWNDKDPESQKFDANELNALKEVFMHLSTGNYFQAMQSAYLTPKLEVRNEYGLTAVDYPVQQSRTEVDRLGINLKSSIYFEQYPRLTRAMSEAFAKTEFITAFPEDQLRDITQAVIKFCPGNDSSENTKFNETLKTYIKNLKTANNVMYNEMKHAFMTQDKYNDGLNDMQRALKGDDPNEKAGETGFEKFMKLFSRDYPTLCILDKPKAQQIKMINEHLEQLILGGHFDHAYNKFFHDRSINDYERVKFKEKLVKNFHVISKGLPNERLGHYLVEVFNSNKGISDFDYDDVAQNQRAAAIETARADNVREAFCKLVDDTGFHKRLMSAFNAVKFENDFEQIAGNWDFNYRVRNFMADAFIDENDKDALSKLVNKRALDADVKQNLLQAVINSADPILMAKLAIHGDYSHADRKRITEHLIEIIPEKPSEKVAQALVDVLNITDDLNESNRDRKLRGKLVLAPGKRKMAEDKIMNSGSDLAINLLGRSTQVVSSEIMSRYKLTGNQKADHKVITQFSDLKDQFSIKFQCYDNVNWSQSKIEYPKIDEFINRANSFLNADEAIMTKATKFHSFHWDIMNRALNAQVRIIIRLLEDVLIKELGREKLAKLVKKLQANIDFNDEDAWIHRQEKVAKALKKIEREWSNKDNKVRISRLSHINKTVLKQRIKDLADIANRAAEKFGKHKDPTVQQSKDYYIKATRIVTNINLGEGTRTLADRMLKLANNADDHIIKGLIALLRAPNLELNQYRKATEKLIQLKAVDQFIAMFETLKNEVETEDADGEDAIEVEKFNKNKQGANIIITTLLDESIYALSGEDCLALAREIRFLTKGSRGPEIQKLNNLYARATKEGLDKLGKDAKSILKLLLTKAELTKDHSEDLANSLIVAAGYARLEKFITSDLQHIKPETYVRAIEKARETYTKESTNLSGAVNEPYLIALWNQIKTKSNSSSQKGLATVFLDDKCSTPIVIKEILSTQGIADDQQILKKGIDQLFNVTFPYGKARLGTFTKNLLEGEGEEHKFMLVDQGLRDLGDKIINEESTNIRGDSPIEPLGSLELLKSYIGNKYKSVEGQEAQKITPWLTKNQIDAKKGRSIPLAIARRAFQVLQDYCAQNPTGIFVEKANMLFTFLQQDQSLASVFIPTQRRFGGGMPGAMGGMGFGAGSMGGLGMAPGINLPGVPAGTNIIQTIDRAIATPDTYRGLWGRQKWAELMRYAYQYQPHFQSRIRGIASTFPEIANLGQ